VFIGREPTGRARVRLDYTLAGWICCTGFVLSGKSPSRVQSVLLIGAEVLPWKITVKVERPQRSEDVRP
jgi:hypothetical protein